MKGPAIFLAQFAGDDAPFNSLDAITKYMGGLGYKGVQIPTWDGRLFDPEMAAESQDYCDEIKGVCAANGVEITELSTHLQGQLVASHPAYDTLFDGFAPTQFHNNPVARTEWAIDQVKMAAKASERFGCTSHATFSGALMWHLMYPWPQRPAGLVEEGFAELARRWKPIFDVFDEHGVDACFELHPGEDLHDGVTFERFLEAVDEAKDNNASCALGPFIRLFDRGFTLDDVRSAVVRLEIEGEDGFCLDGESSMDQISRDPADLVAQAISHHQFPDGFVLFLGTMCAPTQDRDEPDLGFTHKRGDVVRVLTPRLGVLENKVTAAEDAPPWRFGLSDLMHNLAGRGLLA